MQVNPLSGVAGSNRMPVKRVPLIRPSIRLSICLPIRLDKQQKRAEGFVVSS